MENLTLRIIAISLGAVVLMVIVGLLRTRKVREKYAALWLIIAVMVIILAAIPHLATRLAAALGVATPANLVVIGGIVVLFITAIQLSIELGRAEARNRALAEETAILRLRVDRLEQAAMGRTDRSPVPDNGSEQR